MDIRRRVVVLFIVLCFGLGVTAAFFRTVRAAASDEVVDLELTLLAPAHVAAGENYSINLSYSNAGAATAQNVAIVVTLANDVDFVGAKDKLGNSNPPDVVSGNQLTWFVDPVAPDSCYQHLWIEVMVDDTAPEGTSLVTTAEISTSSTDSDLTNNTATSASVVCDMAQSMKQVNSPVVKPGDIFTYTVQIEKKHRKGADPMQSRQVYYTDTLSANHQVRFLGWSGEISGTHDGQSLIWQGMVRSGEPIKLQYRLGVEWDVTPGTVISSQSWLRWTGGEMQLEPVTTVVTLPVGARLYGKQGGKWNAENGIEIDIPAQAVPETTRFEFKSLITGTQGISGPTGTISAYRAFELTAFRFGEIHQFSKPISITIDLNNDEVQRWQQNTLRIWFREGPNERWTQLDSPVQLNQNRLTFTTPHFTQFALFSSGDYQVHIPVVFH